MPQLLPRRRRRTRPAQIHPLKPTHQIRHPTTPTHRHRRSSSSSTTSRRSIKQPHNIRHPPPTTTRSSNRTSHPLGRARPSRILLRARGRSPIKVNIQQILNIALLRAACAGRAVCRGNRRSDGVLGGVLALFLNRGALDGFGAEAALADEGLGGFVVDRGEGGEL